MEVESPKYIYGTAYVLRQLPPISESIGYVSFPAAAVLSFAGREEPARHSGERASLLLEALFTSGSFQVMSICSSCRWAHVDSSGPGPVRALLQRGGFFITCISQHMAASSAQWLAASLGPQLKLSKF